MMKLLYPKFWQRRSIITYLLYPISLIYLLASIFRKISSRPLNFPATVICIGNCTIGGTGKTQIAIYLAKFLTAEQLNFVIVTKAYGSKLKKAVIVEKKHTAEEVGDESLILANYGTVIATKKIQDIRLIINKLRPNIILVDDFLQNPNFYKDCSILVVDAHRLFGNNFLIPAGPLRQNSSKALKNSDLIFLVSANNLLAPPWLSSFTNKLLQADIRPASYTLVDQTRNYIAFSGIGNPERFLLTLKNQDLKILEHKIFPDHYNYSIMEIESLLELAKLNNALLITTRKDYVKICNLKIRKDILDKQIICYDVELYIKDFKKFKTIFYEKIYKKN